MTDTVISSIDEFGVLTVPVNETASTLTVTATSTANPGVSGTATVTAYSISIAPSAGVLSPAFAAGTDTYSVDAPASAGTVAFTATATPSATVTYALGDSGDFSATEPVATLSGLTGSVSFRVKVSAGSTDLIWGPYTFNVARPQYTVSDGLAYTTSDDGTYEILIFTGGTGTVDLAAPVVDFLVVAGGGSGGGNTTQDGAGGGGAGGLVYKENFDVQVGTYTVEVGAGGAAVSAGSQGNPGNPSIFWITSAGAAVNGLSDNGAKATGGGFGRQGYATSQAGSGGSGGGGAGSGGSAYGLGGSATGGTIIGHNGADGTTGSAGGGGGGAGGAGIGKTGGLGLGLDITGTPYIYAKGGNGGDSGNGGAGVNYGDGGTGGGIPASTTGGAGHSGVVIIRWAK